MAKKAKETSTPLVFSLVFFILTTIAFGVMWYLSFSEMEQKNKDLAAKDAEKKPLRDQAREAEQKARVYRAWLGIEVADVTDEVEVAVRLAEEILIEGRVLVKVRALLRADAGALLVRHGVHADVCVVLSLRLPRSDGSRRWLPILRVGIGVLRLRVGIGVLLLLIVLRESAPVRRGYEARGDKETRHFPHGAYGTTRLP